MGTWTPVFLCGFLYKRTRYPNSPRAFQRDIAFLWTQEMYLYGVLTYGRGVELDDL